MRYIFRPRNRTFFRKASWHALRRELLLAIVIEAILAFLTITFGYLWSISPQTLVAVLLLGFALIIGLLMGYKRCESDLAELSITDFIPYNDFHKPTEDIPVNARISGVRQEFTFLGVSANTLWDTSIFKLIKAPECEGCHFRFLLLDPEGKAIQRRLADEPDSSLEGVRFTIDGFVERICTTRSAVPTHSIEIRFYDLYPWFWIIQNDKRMYVQPFPHGNIGKESPLLVLEYNQHDGFFGAFKRMLDDIWDNYAVPLDCDNYNEHD